MKKLSYLLLGLAGLTMASCSQEEVSNPAANNGKGFSVEVSLPGDYATRALSDGFTATELTVVVYDSSTQNYVTTVTAQFPANSLTTTVNFELAYNKSYTMFYFAQSKTSQDQGVYTVNGAAGSVDVNYSKMTSPDNIADAYDCFYLLQNTPTITPTTPVGKATLYRFVAQINWGTNDMLKDAISNNDAFGVDGQYVRTNFSGQAYSKWNILEQAVDDKSLVNVSFRDWSAPAKTEAFPVVSETTTYQYVAMQYLLVKKDKSVFNYSLDINNGGNPNANVVVDNYTMTVSEVPAQQNFRTNIYGSLLTCDYEVNVEKWPNYWTPDYDVTYPQQ